MSMLKLLNSKYEILEKLGEGATSEVYLTTEYGSTKQYAMKMLKGTQQLSEKLFTQEYQMVNRVNHPNIISMIQAGNGDIQDALNNITQSYYFLFELAEKGDLLDYVLYPQKGFSESQAKYIFSEILFGIKACHDAGIAHNDIKPENIMVNSDYRFKLSDFGFATLLEGKKQDGKLTSFKGTPGYQAPEIIKKIPYDGIKSDLFSLAIVLFVLIYARPPFAFAKQFDLHYQYIAGKKYDTFWKITKVKNKCDITIELKDLFNKLFACNPQERIDFEEIINHPWFTNCQPASYEEIQREFSERYSIILNEKNKEKNAEMN